MSKINISILSCTSQTNLTLSEQIAEVCREKLNSEYSQATSKCEVINIEKLDLPLYTPPTEEKGIPETAIELSKKLQDSDVIILVAPEYNGSIPPVMTNMVAWVSRTGEDWRKAFNQKISLVASHSGGGGQKVCQAMRSQLEHLGCLVIPRQIIVNYSKPFDKDNAHAVLASLFKYLKA